MKAGTYSPFVVFIAIMFNDANCESSQTVLRKLSTAFGAIVWDCRIEVTFPMDIIEDFLHYWETSYVFLNPELGCVTMCVLLKLQLVDHNNRVIEKNAIGFAKANYADEKIAHQLLSYAVTCLQAIESNATLAKVKKPCTVGLALAKCFRGAVLQNHQVPQLTKSYDDEYGYD